MSVSEFKGFGRRGSLVALAGTALTAALGVPIVAEAGKSRKNKKAKKRKRKIARKARKQGKALCARQAESCDAFFEDTCPDDPSCQRARDECCPSLGTCDNGAFWACFLADPR